VILSPRSQKPTYATATNYNNSIFHVLMSVAMFWDDDTDTSTILETVMSQETETA